MANYQARILLYFLVGLCSGTKNLIVVILSSGHVLLNSMVLQREILDKLVQELLYGRMMEAW